MVIVHDHESTSLTMRAEFQVTPVLSMDSVCMFSVASCVFFVLASLIEPYSGSTEFDLTSVDGEIRLFLNLAWTEVWLRNNMNGVVRFAQTPVRLKLSDCSG